jgi:tetratricopeptide (TPR) repeat protein
VDFTHIIESLPRPTLDWGPTFGAYTDAFVNRGNAYMAKREFQKAVADYTEAIRLEPKLAPVYEHRGAAYRALGQTDKAMRDDQQAKALKG